MRTVETRDAIVQEMRARGFSLVSPEHVAACFGVANTALLPLSSTWNDLPRDAYLKDGGKYRSRRHSSFVQTMAPPELTQVAHRAHWPPQNTLQRAPATPEKSRAPSFLAQWRLWSQPFALIVLISALILVTT